MSELGGEWADTFTDAPPAVSSASNPSQVAPIAPSLVVESGSPPESVASTQGVARPAQGPSLSELVLDAELLDAGDDILSPESFAATPEAPPATPAKTSETADVLTGDDLADDDILEAVDAMSAEPARAATAEATDILEDMDVLSAEPHQAPAPAAPDSLGDVGTMSAGSSMPSTDAAGALEDVGTTSADSPKSSASVASDIFDDVDVLSAEPSSSPASEAADILGDVDVLSAEPPSSPAAEAADVLGDVDVLSAEPHAAASVPGAEPVWDAVSEPTSPEASAEPKEPLTATPVTESPHHEPPLAAAALDDVPVKASVLEGAPQAPALVEAAKPVVPAPQSSSEQERSDPLAPADVPAVSVIAAAAQDPEAESLEFSLVGDSPRSSEGLTPPPSTDAGASEAWQVAAAPKTAAERADEPPASTGAEPPRTELPPEFEVALISDSEPSSSAAPEPAAKAAPSTDATLPTASEAAGAASVTDAQPHAEEPPKPRLVVAPPAPVRDRTPISLEDLPAPSEEPMQLASTWEFVGWQGGGEGEGGVGHSADTTWVDRVVDLEVPASAPASSEDGVALASAWEFMQQPWQPQAVARIDPAQALLAAASASSDTPQDGPVVTAEQVLSALDTADSQGMVGKVLLAYSAGRFRRAFLLGDSFGLARVGRAWGPGSDRPEVTALKVDLDAPSLLASALTGPSPSVFSAPQGPQDEAIFSALCEAESHLLVFPLHARGQPVAFFVAEHGPSPLEVPMLEELGRIAERAVEICTRLHRFP